MSSRLGGLTGFSIRRSMRTDHRARRAPDKNELMYRSPAKVRVNNGEFQDYARRLAAVKAALVAQREMMHIYERRWKKGVMNTMKNQERISWMYPDDDEIRDFMEDAAHITQGTKGKLETITGGTAERSYKRMEDQYRRYLAEIGSIEKEFQFAEELQSRIQRQERMLMRMNASRRGVDPRRLDALESEMENTQLSFDRTVDRTIERMKVTEEKFDTVFHAGHIAVWAGFAEHIELTKSENSKLMEWAESTFEELLNVDVTNLTEENEPFVDLIQIDENRVSVPARQRPVAPRAGSGRDVQMAKSAVRSSRGSSVVTPSRARSASKGSSVVSPRRAHDVSKASSVCSPRAPELEKGIGLAEPAADQAAAKSAGDLVAAESGETVHAAQGAEPTAPSAPGRSIVIPVDREVSTPVVVTPLGPVVETKGKIEEQIMKDSMRFSSSTIASSHMSVTKATGTASTTGIPNLHSAPAL